MFSKILRRSHLYAALFLTPWVLLYAISTIVMNHKERQGPPLKWQTVSETTYDGVFPTGGGHREIARQILATLDLDGAHQSSQRPDGTIVIQRNAARQPLRLTFSPSTKKLLVEKQEVTTTAFLERMHRRRGFQQPYALDDTWAFSVDVFIAAVLFWALSGLWLWWELKVTRPLGAFTLIAGLGIFAFFLGSL